MRPPEAAQHPTRPRLHPLPQPAPSMRPHAPDPTDADAARRNFLTRSYPTMKKHNPHTPIMIREASGIEPTVYARFGAFRAASPHPPRCQLTRRMQTLARRRSCRSRASTTSRLSSRLPSLSSPRYRCAGTGEEDGVKDERMRQTMCTCATRGAGAVPVYIDECTCSGTLR
jgi:hypothetical protein